MPMSAPKPCSHPGCRALVSDGTTRCEEHKVRQGTFADRSRGSRHERGYGSEWTKTRERILQRDCGLCQACKRKGILTAVGMTKYSAYVDHIVPKFEGGTDDDSNLETLCRSCHTAKTDKEKNRGRGASNLWRHAM